MKNLKFIFPVLLMFMATSLVYGQAWTTYQVDSDPVTEFTPAFEESNAGGVFERTQIVDPNDASNNLLRIITDQDTDASSDNYQLRQQIGATTPTAITVVFRAKGNDPAKFFLFDVDMDFNTFRSQIRIHNDGTVDVANGTPAVAPDPLTINTQEWNTYRYTRSGDQFALYVNEDPTPVVTGTAQAASGNNFFRFGDGWGSSGTRGISTDFDWVTWDLTGAYSPSDQALPPELLPSTANWTIYQADLDPVLEFVPAFEESNAAGVYERTQIADPNNASNNLLRIITDQDTDGSSDNYQLRQRVGDPQPTAITVVFRAKGNDPAKFFLFDMDMDFNTFRSQVRIHTDGTIDVANGTATAPPDPLTINTQDWNIYRFTRDGDQFALYVNEDPTPVVTGTGDGGRTNDYYRFGDGWGSSGTRGISTDFDWVTWDYTGAYSPSDQALPDDLVDQEIPLGDWVIYNADVEPDVFDPVFSESNGAGTFTYGTLADNYIPGNNLLEIRTDDDPLSEKDNIQLRQYTDEDAVTVVLKARTIDIANKGLLFDIDFRSLLSARFAIKVLNDGTYDIDKGGDGVVADKGDWGFDATEWNIFRVTKAGDVVNIYINENPTPIFTLTAPASVDGSGYWRFGDGWTNEDVDTQYDWVTWDYTGAYAPDQARLPDELTGEGGDQPDPKIKVLGSIDLLSQDLGFAPDFSIDTYKLSGTDLTGDITITPPVNFEVSVDTTNWFTNANPLVIVQDGGIVEDTVIIVRLNATAIGDYTGDISNASPGAEEELVSVSGTTIELMPEITTTGTLQGFVQNISTPSASQNYRVSGINLKDSVLVTAPTGFEISKDDITWGASFKLGGADRTITNTLVYVRQFGSAIGDLSGSISHTSLDATEATIDLAGTVISDPGITVTGEFAEFSQSLGTPSAAQSYTLSGSSLTSNVSISLSDGFEISLDGDLWLNSLTIVPLEGAVEEMTLNIRLNATATGASSGNIVHSSTGVEDVNLAVSGTTNDIVLAAGSELNEIAFAVWPNPSSNKITVQRENELGEAKVSIYSIQGELISRHAIGSGSKLLELDISSYESGIYIVGYEGNGLLMKQRFIKK